MYSFRKCYSIYDKHTILTVVEEMGEQEFFDRTGNVIVKRKSSLKIWRQQLSAIALPLKKSQHFKQVSYRPLEIDDLMVLARKNFLVNSRGPQDLSNSIQPVFNKKLSGEKLTRAEQKELKLLNLIDDNGSLTSLGMAQKLSKVSCRKQCGELKIPLSKMVFHNDDELIEIRVLKRLNSAEGVKWFYVENKFYEFFIVNMFTPISAELGVGAYRSEGVIRKDLEKEFVCKFTERYFYSYINSIERSRLSFVDGRDPKFSIMSSLEVANVYRAFGYHRFLSVLKHDFIEPKVYSRGWPDLLGLHGEQLKFVEVKKADKLTISQIETIPRIIEMGISVEVLIAEIKLNGSKFD